MMPWIMYSRETKQGVVDYLQKIREPLLKNLDRIANPINKLYSTKIPKNKNKLGNRFKEFVWER